MGGGALGGHKGFSPSLRIVLGWRSTFNLGGPPMSKHLADHRKAPTETKVKNFLRLSREKRDTWHHSRPAAGKSRLLQFLRIARGRTV